MASSGKKGKKKTKFVPLVVGPTVSAFPVTRKTTNWIDEVENELDAFESRPKAQLPTAPRAACAPSGGQPDIPQDGPFIAYISNLSYNVDEQDLHEFFANMNIKEMRLPREDKESGKIRGFGYVEFSDRNSLVEAIYNNNSSLKGRRMHIEVAQENERGRRGNRMDMNRDRPERSESSSGGDWRCGPRTETQPESAPIRRGGGFNREYEPASESKGGWRDAERPSFNDRRDNDRGFTRRNYDRDDRDGGGFTRSNREPTSDNVERERPRLALQPRKEQTAAIEAASETAVPAPSIFGAAKPVDTAAREREIEAKLAKERESKLAEIAAKKVEEKESESKDPKPPPVVENSWRVDRAASPQRRRESPQRRRDSPQRRRYSPDQRRRYSPDRRGDSPQRRRDSPQRRRYSPDRRRDSPPRKRYSPPRRRDSPPRRRDSPPRRRDSPSRRRDSPPRRRDSPPRRRDSPPRRRDSPPRRRESPTRKRDGGGPPIRRNNSDRDDRKAPAGPRNDVKERNNKAPPRNVRMPKKEEEEAPNFAESNKFALIEPEDSGSD